MKNRRSIRILLVVALVAALIFPVYAYMVHISQTVANEFTPANVTCKIVEEFDGENKTSIAVKNTSNIDAYIRVQLSFHWQDSKGNVVARVPKDGEPAFPPKVEYDGNWKAMGNYIYCYKLPVKPGESTGNLLKLDEKISMTPVVITTTDGTKYTYYPVVEVLAEAIQSLPVTAVEGAWGVTIKEGSIQ